MSVNRQRAQAMKRLAADLDELEKGPVPAVSATPLDENMFEWHCNFLFDDSVYHLILFFPEKYPYVSPSAEFVPRGFQFVGGATRPGKKGMQVCLSIFSDFADIHTEWANEKSAGWSPGYTVQTVLLNLVSFMAETMGQYTSSTWGSSYADNALKANKKLAQEFTCTCGHTHGKPFPPLESAKKGGKTDVAAKPEADDLNQISDYISKVKFKASYKPKSEDDLYGFGLIQSGPSHRPALTTPCEYLTGASFYGMEKSVGKVKSILKEDLAFFLPMYISTTHGAEIKDSFEKTMKALAKVLPKCNPNKTPVDVMVTKTIPNLMSATVVEYSKGTQHTSENSLNGYFALHRLFLWAINTYPALQKIVDDRLQEFIDNEDRRSKSACPHIGEWLMLLAASSKYRWQDAAHAYLSESWKRNVMWYVKDDAKLGFLDSDQKYRLEQTLKATEVSRKLLAFQVLFLDIAMPADMTRQQIIKRYDDHMGLPTDAMVAEMKDACSRISKMKTYDDWFKVLKLTVLSNDEICKRLTAAVEFSINTNGYHWSFWKNQGGWGQVLKKYPKGTPGWTGKPKNAPKAKDGAGAGAGAQEGATKGTKGKGRGKSTSSEAAAKEEPMDVDKPKPAAARGRGRGGKRKAEESSSEEEEEVLPKPGGKGGARGRGRGRGGRGRGKVAKVEEPEPESESESEEDEAAPAAATRGRGRGRGGRGGTSARGRGRGGRRGK